MSISVHQVARLTPPQRKADAQYVRVVRTKYGYTKEGWGFIAAQTYSTHVRQAGWIVPNENPDKYVTVLTLLNKKMHGVWSCSCPDFTFTWEVALTYKEASVIEYSNGEPPDTRNPTFKSGTCKHCYALYLRVKDRLVPR